MRRPRGARRSMGVSSMAMQHAPPSPARSTAYRAAGPAQAPRPEKQEEMALPGGRAASRDTPDAQTLSPQQVSDWRGRGPGGRGGAGGRDAGPPDACRRGHARGVGAGHTPRRRRARPWAWHNTATSASTPPAKTAARARCRPGTARSAHRGGAAQQVLPAARRCSARQNARAAHGGWVEVAPHPTRWLRWGELCPAVLLPTLGRRAASCIRPLLRAPAAIQATGARWLRTLLQPPQRRQPPRIGRTAARDACFPTHRVRLSAGRAVARRAAQQAGSHA